MAIQFLCSSCGKPIEVDDDAASQSVTCPYCNALVTAPAVSDASIGAAGLARDPMEGRGETPPPLPARQGNRMGWCSLICVGLGLAGWAATIGLIYRAISPVQLPISQQEVSRRLMQAVADQPGLKAAMTVTMVGGCGLPIVGLALAVWSLMRDRRPRWPAIAALAIFGLSVCYLLMHWARARGGDV
jgi:hypothetical protein